MPGPFTTETPVCEVTIDLQLTRILDDAMDTYQRILVIDRCILGDRPCDPVPEVTASSSIKDKVNALGYEVARLKEAVQLVHSYLV